jgi:hypothetical protein
MTGSRRMLILFAGLLVCAPCCWSQIGEHKSIIDPRKDWAEVLRFQDEADSAKKAEESNPGSEEFRLERVKRFTLAAQKVREYALLHSQPGDLSRLRLTYRMAVDLELSEQFEEELKALSDCQNHDLYHSPKSLYDSKRIDELVPTRVNVASTRVRPGAPLTIAPGFETQPTQLTVITETKGLIQLGPCKRSSLLFPSKRYSEFDRQGTMDAETYEWNGTLFDPLDPSFLAYPRRPLQKEYISVDGTLSPRGAGADCRPDAFPVFDFRLF